MGLAAIERTGRRRRQKTDFMTKSMASELAQVKRAFYSVRVNTSKPVVVPDLSGASFLTLVAADLRATIVANPSERLSPPAT
jgi:hypothetical protein